MEYQIKRKKQFLYSFVQQYFEHSKEMVSHYLFKFQDL